MFLAVGSPILFVSPHNARPLGPRAEPLSSGRWRTMRTIGSGTARGSRDGDRSQGRIGGTFVGPSYGRRVSRITVSRHDRRRFGPAEQGPTTLDDRLFTDPR
ncbi:hypothetical protein KM043_011087 [Ampulex compressa]|nr:hypothetical protein KM043_011087 [Ampulex compressa]